MTSVAKYETYVEWDVRNWSTALEFWESHTALDIDRSKALEIGSRHGGLSLWLAQQGANVVCSDVDGPTPHAHNQHAAAGVADRIRYEAIDATAIPYESAFDLVVFKSVLGSIDGPDRRLAQARAIAEMHRALRPNGELFFAENLAASPAHRFLRRRFVGWGRRWRYVSVVEMLEFLRPFRTVEYRTVGFSGALGRSRRQREILGTVDRALLDRIVPESWRYIMLGVARK